MPREPREGRTSEGTYWGDLAEAPGQLKRLGTDAFTGVSSSAKSKRKLKASWDEERVRAVKV